MTDLLRTFKTISSANQVKLGRATTPKDAPRLDLALRSLKVSLNSLQNHLFQNLISLRVFGIAFGSKKIVSRERWVSWDLAGHDLVMTSQNS